MNGLHLRRPVAPLSNSLSGILNCCAKAVQWCLPAGCVLCGADAGTQALCGDCESALPRLSVERCIVCALPLTSGRVCGTCLDAPPAYDRVTAAFAYAFPIDALVLAYKYGGRLTLAPLLASPLARDVGGAVDVIVPMPLAPARLRERGFNQAHELARLIGSALGVPVLPRACRKVADTPPQAALPWKERARNVRRAFVCDVDLRDRRVAVVDDVMTSGATLNELARTLKRAGAAEVTGWVVARTLR